MQLMCGSRFEIMFWYCCRKYEKDLFQFTNFARCGALHRGIKRAIFASHRQLPPLTVLVGVRLFLHKLVGCAPCFTALWQHRWHIGLNTKKGPVRLLPKSVAGLPC